MRSGPRRARYSGRIPASRPSPSRQPYSASGRSSPYTCHQASAHSYVANRLPPARASAVHSSRAADRPSSGSRVRSVTDGRIGPLRDGTPAVEGTGVADVLVLCYHALSETWPAALSTTPGLFERQLSLLLDRGYRAKTFTAALTETEGGRTLVVTFDDAYRSVDDLARPIMERLGGPRAVFVAPGRGGPEGA